MDYNDCGNGCEIEDLLLDQSFRDWVLNSRSDTSLFWENWLIRNPDKESLVKEARIILKSTQFAESCLTDDESSFLLERIKKTNAAREEKKYKNAIVRPINKNIPFGEYKNKKAPMGYLLRYAAILGGALIFALSINLILGNFTGAADSVLVEKVNGKGQKSTIFLPDGSVVTLNSSSRLLYPEMFEPEERKVYLEGEAFFEVTKSNKPFIVQTDHLNTRVLGTSFNVQAYPCHEEYSVSLLTGKVQVYRSEDARQHLILKPGQKGKMDKKDGILNKTEFEFDQEIGWKEGILAFKDLPFEEALYKLENWYGIEFIPGKLPVEKYQVTGRFVNESLENVLTSIGFSMKFDYEIEGNKVHLKFKK